MQDDKDDTDNDSVATAEGNNRTIANKGERKEYVVKFLFRPTNENKSSEIALTHYKILKTINEIYPDETTIYDNFGQTIKEFKPPKSYDEYLRHFSLQYVKGNESRKRKPIYMAFHRLLSTVPISEIRKHVVVSTLLQKVNTCLTIHQWKEDETNISILGFFTKVDPGNVLKEEFEETIKTEIATATQRAKKKIPVFRCTFSSPYVHIKQEDYRISTKSYDLQCRQKDAKDLIKLLHATYGNNPKFVFHRLRHVNEKIYMNAIRMQNNYLSKSRVVPIRGVTEEIMFALDNDLLQIEGVYGIHKHRETETKGRWSIMTNEVNFKNVVDQFRAHLKHWVLFYATEFPPPENFPAPALAFKNQPHEEESEGSIQSFDSYVSNCSNLYTAQDDLFDAPPAKSNPTPQAWGNHKVPDLIDSTVSTPASGISQDDFDRVSRENARLTRKIDTLMEQVQALLVKETKVEPTPKAQVKLDQAEIAQIVAAVTQAMLEKEKSQQQMDTDPALVNTDLTQSPSCKDMSFDAEDADDDERNQN